MPNIDNREQPKDLDNSIFQANTVVPTVLYSEYCTPSTVLVVSISQDYFEFAETIVDTTLALVLTTLGDRLHILGPDNLESGPLLRTLLGVSLEIARKDDPNA